MTSNPMQRKSRISFLVGMVVTLLIMGIVTGVLYSSMTKTIKGLKDELAHQEKSVLVFTQDVKSGQVIDPETMLQSAKIDDRQIPSTATSDASLVADYTLTDKTGNAITFSSSANGEMEYTYNDGTGSPKKLQLADATDAEGNKMFFYEENGETKYVETGRDPLIAKVDIKAKTVFSFDIVARGADTLTNDARWQEYNMVTLPSELISGDVVDIRLQLPTGEDFIVLPKKKVLFPGTEDEGEAPTSITDVIKLSVNEAEMLTMSSAIVDAYQIIGSKLYVVKYTEPGIQEAATGTYSPSGSTVELINKDPNIVDRARAELKNRENSGSNQLRENFINQAITDSGIEGQENVKTKQQESITKSQTTRQTYLEGLGG